MNKQKLTKEQRKELALNEYLKVKQPAWNEYEKVRELALEKYLEECIKIDSEPDEIPEIIEHNGIRYKRIMESEK